MALTKYDLLTKAQNVVSGVPTRRYFSFRDLHRSEVRSRIEISLDSAVHKMVKSAEKPNSSFSQRFLFLKFEHSNILRFEHSDV